MLMVRANHELEEGRTAWVDKSRRELFLTAENKSFPRAPRTLPITTSSMRIKSLSTMELRTSTRHLSPRIVGSDKVGMELPLRTPTTLCLIRSLMTKISLILWILRLARMRRWCLSARKSTTLGIKWFRLRERWTAQCPAEVRYSSKCQLASWETPSTQVTIIRSRLTPWSKFEHRQSLYLSSIIPVTLPL